MMMTMSHLEEEEEDEAGGDRDPDHPPPAQSRNNQHPQDDDQHGACHPEDLPHKQRACWEIWTDGLLRVQRV